MGAALPELYKIVRVAAPQAAGSLTATDYICTKNANKVWFIISHSGASDNDMTFSFVEATEVAGTTTAAVTFVGSASTNYVQSLMYHKDAFQFITADLPLMDGAHKCSRRTQDGLSLRVWMDGDIRHDELLMRIDMLYGMAALRPEWACRMIGSANA